MNEKIIGVGNTATVYEWQENKVLKLFHEGYPLDAVEREFHNAFVLNQMSFHKPYAYEIVSLNGRHGIIYDQAAGESLLDWVLKTGDIHTCAKYMANLHKEIIYNQVTDVPNYKDFLYWGIHNSSKIDAKRREEVLNKMDALPEGDSLCHGDFHPGNIIISDGKGMVIDFMNVCHGNPLYDIARTVFLVEYTPIPEDVEDKELMRNFKKSLADLYLMNMDITRDMIKDYLEVIIAARTGECPNEE
jgi:Ser/Thr protein kinase RdoA (MazF antagonist)